MLESQQFIEWNCTEIGIELGKRGRDELLAFAETNLRELIQDVEKNFADTPFHGSDLRLFARLDIGVFRRKEKYQYYVHEVQPWHGADWFSVFARNAITTSVRPQDAAVAYLQDAMNNGFNPTNDVAPLSRARQGRCNILLLTPKYTPPYTETKHAPKLSRTELELLANSFSDHDICSDDGSSSPVEPLVFHQLELLANSFSDHDSCPDDGLSPGRSSPVEPLIFHQLELLANSFSDHDSCSDDDLSPGRSSPVEPLIFHQLELLANSFSDYDIHSDDGSSAMPLHSDDGFSPGRWPLDHPSDSSPQCMSESSISDQDHHVEGEYAPEYILKREPSENDVDGEEGDIIQLTGIGTLAAEAWLDSHCIEAWLLSQWRSLNKPSPAYVPFSFISGGANFTTAEKQSYEEFLDAEEMEEQDIVCFLHIGGNHYCVALFAVAARVLHLLGSAVRPAAGLEKRRFSLNEHHRLAWQRLCALHGWDDSSSEVTGMETNWIQNGYDCGPIACQVIFHIWSEGFLTDIRGYWTIPEFPCCHPLRVAMAKELQGLCNQGLDTLQRYQRLYPNRDDILGYDPEQFQMLKEALDAEENIMAVVEATIAHAIPSCMLCTKRGMAIARRVRFAEENASSRHQAHGPPVSS
ncbi:hypothetical protein IMY05_C3416000500 [Salix suchowensis]|nr:hypothetical protein IMY05_C3416000500 [Salix suchowensis]